MGLLVLGEPISWRQTALLRYFVKYHGIIQFIKAYNKHKNRKCDRFLWGDEIECLLLHMDDETHTLKAQLRANQILEELHQEQAAKANIDTGSELNITFHPEYANNMLEVTPFIPYGGSVLDLVAVETNMRLRRAVLQSKLKRGEFVLYSCNFPLFGTPNFTRSPPENRILPNTPIPTSTNSSVLNTLPLPQTNDQSIGSNTELNEEASTPLGQQELPQLGPVLKSNYVPDEIMSPHPRFATLSGNIRRRRGKKVDILLPMFEDKKTNMERFPDKNIHSDAMGFGMGSCCLQVTFQTHSNTEARFLHDQMAILAPIFLSLTANTPFHRGYIVDSDVRWDTICQAVDDRTDAEKGLVVGCSDDFSDDVKCTAKQIAVVSPLQTNQDIPELLEENPYLVHFRNKFNNIKNNSAETNHPEPKQIKTIDDWAVDGIGVPYNDLPISVTQPGVENVIGTPRIYKSRYSSIDCYLNHDPRFGYHPKYNDVKFPYHEPSYELLIENGVDKLMAKYISGLWIRDPLVMFQGQITQDDDTQMNHFESIQSTNWRSVRYKPPSHAANPGFRVEFRTMELSFTDFENAAFTVFLALLARSIVHFELHLYLPLSKVDENFIYAHRNHSVANDTFWFRSTIELGCPPTPAFSPQQTSSTLSPSKKIGNIGHCTPCCGAQVDPNIPVEQFSLDSSSSDDSLPTPEEQTEVPPQPDMTIKPSCSIEKMNQNYQDSSRRMTINEIINGSDDFVGLIPIVRQYLNTIRADEKSLYIINQYLSFVAARADLSLMTGAQFQRQFIMNHPSYKHDSVLPQDAVRDLIMVLHGLSNQTCHVEELLGRFDPTLDLELDGNEQDENSDNSNCDEIHELFNKPTINLQMATLLSQLRELPSSTPYLNQDGEISNDITGKNELEQILLDNQSIILGLSRSNKTPVTPHQELISNTTNLSSLEFNSRSNFKKLLNNPHTRTLQKLFTAAQGEAQLELLPNLKGSKRCVDMAELHGHAPSSGGQPENVQDPQPCGQISSSDCGSSGPVVETQVAQ
jgi:glutamate--cysteine ligase catalytic subunit